MKTNFSFRLLLMIITSGSFLFSFGQERLQNLDLRPLLFKDFLKADILKKDGSLLHASVNYNTDNQSLIFLTKDEYMELTELDQIEQIEIDHDVFVPINGKIYQKTGRNDLFISYSNKVAVNDIVVSHRGSEIKDARESHNSSLGNVYVSKNYDNLNDLAFVKKFWVVKEGELVEVSNVKKLSKAFDISRNEVNAFVKAHNLNFNNYSDITSLLDYIAKN
jgi:hypothetical protein